MGCGSFLASGGRLPPPGLPLWGYSGGGGVPVAKGHRCTPCCAGVGAVACPARGCLDVALENSGGASPSPTPGQPANGSNPARSTAWSTPRSIPPKELTEAVDQAMEELIQAQASEIQYYLNE